MTSDPIDAVREALGRVAPDPETPTKFKVTDWVTERRSVSEGEVIEVYLNPAGKEIVMYEMTNGLTVRQFADFLEMGKRPVEAETNK
jgi:hypothetical protein